MTAPMPYSVKPNAVTVFMSIVGVVFLLGTSWAIIAALQTPGEDAVPANGEQASPAERIETHIDQGAAALDVKVVPTELLEDSRCPTDAQCIQAGTVRVRAILESGLGEARQVFELGIPITTEAEEVTLVAVDPQPMVGSEIPLSQYRFVFEIKKRPVSN